MIHGPNYALGPGERSCYDHPDNLSNPAPHHENDAQLIILGIIGTRFIYQILRVEKKRGGGWGVGPTFENKHLGDELSE